MDTRSVIANLTFRNLPDTKSSIMYRRIVPALLFITPLFVFAQNTMTPELLWQLGRVSGLGISKDGKYILYSVTTPDATENKSSKKTYMIPVGGGDAVETTK